MKKYFIWVLFFAFLLSAVLIYATPKILMAHIDMIKDGQEITCNYCHSNPVFTIEKKKGQLEKGLLNGVPLSEIKTCAGSGCH
ncbi:MAG: hypothetical protein WDA74_01325 [Spirochaetota bacterium]